MMDKGTGRAVVGAGGFTDNQWEELTFQFGESETKVYLNGMEIFSYACDLASSYANCLGAGGCFVISGDNDGEDNEMYWADVKVYDGIVDP